VWTFTALDAETKLMVSWMVGDRDGTTAYQLMSDLKERITDRIQLTTDGFPAYADAVGAAFGGAVDYAMLVKIYGQPKDGPRGSASLKNEIEVCGGLMPRFAASVLAAGPWGARRLLRTLARGCRFDQPTAILDRWTARRKDAKKRAAEAAPKSAAHVNSGVLILGPMWASTRAKAFAPPRPVRGSCGAHSRF
jgi:hypothetical protein